MELEELQAAWAQLGAELEQQKKLTDKIIMEMTQEKYSNKFRALTNYEAIGAVICYGAAILLVLNFEKLDTWYLFSCGLISLLFMTILPTLVLRSLFNIKKLDIGNGNFKTNLLNYTKAKNNLLRLQQIAIGVGFSMLFVLIPVSSKVLSNKDIFQSELNIRHVIGLVLALIFMVFFCRWGYRGYKEITASAESIIKDLE